RLRAEVCGLKAERGEVTGCRGGRPSDISSPEFVVSDRGCCTVWARPRRGGEYIAAVDIGGRSRRADWSVISVLDRHTDAQAASDRRPEVVAQWRGHIDHDLLAWKAAALAAWYNEALLVVESNTWETSSEGRGRYILNMLADSYPNLYYRSDDMETDTPGVPARKPGFHTNVRTKPSVIANLIALVRDGGYLEHSSEACDELMQYEVRADGSYAARRDCHDDILMSRAIALWIHVSDAPVAVPPDLSLSDLYRSM
ncbi:MAG: hypothetical protein K2H88_04135, partial [Duncaniella sp.]|nr:hypothetical protein [Duncaniella sp.]